MNESSTLALSSVWLLWLLCAAQLAFAARALVVERREGMRLSLRRVGFVAATAFAATILAVSASWSRGGADGVSGAVVSASAPGTTDPRTEAQERIDGINAQIKSLMAKRQDAQIERNKIPNETASTQPWLQIPAPSTDTSLALITMLAIAGFVLLLVAGEVQTLLPDRWRGSRGGAGHRAKASEAMNAVAAAVWRSEYLDALRAAAINPKWLPDGDRRDLVFLRAYCSVQLRTTATPEVADAARVPSPADVIKELESLLEDAPRRGDALYLLGLALGMADRHADALAAFSRAEEALEGHELPFGHNRSVCLLSLGEACLGNRDTAQAEKHFEEVQRIGTLRDAVVDSRISIELTDLRKALGERKFEAVSESVKRLQEFKSLREGLGQQLNVITSALEVLLALRTNEIPRALKETEVLLQRHLPQDMPRVDDDAAEEVLAPAITDEQLGSLPRRIYREFLFMRSVAVARSVALQGKVPSPAQVNEIAEPLLRGLQFEPRQADLLAALGGLFYWFRRDQRPKALEWLQSAAAMGAAGRFVHLILEQDRLVEVERRELLDWFRSASSRFLKDPTLASGVRAALVKELGRFQEFEPLLIELDEKLQMASEEPTLQLMKDRARYLAQLVSEVSCRGAAERQTRLQAIHAEYIDCVTALEQTTERMAQLEGRVFGELGGLLEFH